MRAELSCKRNKVFVDNPHPQSLAHLILLIAHYEYKEQKKWLQFRYKYLKSQTKVWFKPWTWFSSKPWTLTCNYCKKSNLVEDIKLTNESHLATIDHIIPLSKGGKKFDRKNLCVACYPCNSNKKDKLILK
jgi:5-methylcytosine-specific restriction endonuclease McrA